MRFLNDEVVKAKMASALPLSEVDASKYDAVFYPGGHGPMFDLPTDVHNIDIATKVISAFRPLYLHVLIIRSQVYNAGKILAAVCHGPA